MGLLRVIVERDFRSVARHARGYWPIWRDLDGLSKRLDDPAWWFSGGIVKVTRPQFRALPERNRRVVASKDSVTISPLLVWVEGRGLIQAIRKD